MRYFAPMKILRSLLCLFLCTQLILPPGLSAEDLPYSLVDKNEYDLFSEEQEAQREKELTIEEPQDDAQLLKYSDKFWRQAVTSVEGAYKLDKDPEPIPDLTLLNPTLSLPLYGTSIALTGRYVLGFKMDAKRYKVDDNNTTEQRDVSSNSMVQELQLKMQGKILDRVFVDIDYDDQREEEKTLSVAYRGKPGEVVQLAEFGDINLSLPETEFIAYQKQLFGAQMHLQYKDLDLRLIGSQTKGSSKQKQFVGSSVLAITSLSDADYKRRTYYDLTFGGNIKKDTQGRFPTGFSTDAYLQWSSVMGSISPGTEEIYLDANNTDNDFVPISKTASDVLGGTQRRTSNWRLLVRGTDYTVDYASGIIQFKRTITAESFIAVDYVSTTGNRLSQVMGNQGDIKLIKTENEKPFEASANETANQLELKTYYSLGAQQITRDDGKGNFLLRVMDAAGQEIALPITGGTGTLTYPNNIVMDFDNGVFYLQRRFADNTLYNATPVSSYNRTFKVEYTSKVKTYFIEANIVVQSETVKLNGKTLTRNNDYYIDYTSGFITFYKGDEITDSSVIDITYDTVSGSSSNTSVLGGRLDYKLWDKIKLGATVLQEGGDKPTTVPQVGASSKDLLVYGADINGKDIKLSEKVSVDFGAEAAESRNNPNQFGYAMVDSMNETSIQTGGSKIFRDWIIAANPSAKPAFWGSIGWDTQDVPTLEVNPNSVSTYNDTQQVLIVNYDFTKAVTTINQATGKTYLDEGYDEVSIVYPLSVSGVDLSDKTSFDLTMKGEKNGPQLNVTFGNISEYSDNSQGMYTQCSSSTLVPKTEDVLCRNSLAPNEDIGWEYIDPDGTAHRYNPFVNNVYNPESQPNGRIDTQDLNANGQFDDESIPTLGNFGFEGGEGSISNNDQFTWDNNRINFDSWQTFVTPLDIADVKDQWTAVRHIRLTLKLTDEMRAAGKYKGQIKIANVALSGTAWNTMDDNEEKRILVTGINNVDNANYEPIFNDVHGDGLEVFNYLYGSVGNLKKVTDSVNAKDQSLDIEFNTQGLPFVPDDATDEHPEGELYASRNFSTMDFTQHREFRFLLHSEESNAGSEFFLKVGTENNYDKVIVPAGFDGWRLISLKMVDTDGDGIADSFENASKEEYNVRVARHRVPGGMMNFKQVSLIIAGMQAQNIYTYVLEKDGSSQTVYASGALNAGVMLYKDKQLRMSFAQVSAKDDHSGIITITTQDKETYTVTSQTVETLGSAGNVWLNEIHLAETIIQYGQAYTGNVAVKLDGWGSAGAKYKYQDSNFETPLTVSKNQETTQEEYFLKVDRIEEFPMEATLTRSTVVTPSIEDSADYNTVSLLDKGKVERERAVVRGDFIKENLPKVGLEYTSDQTDYDLLQRKDDVHTYGITVTHETDTLKSANAGYYFTNTKIDYAKEMHQQSVNNYNTDEDTQKLNVKLNYQPTNNFNFVPSYNITKSTEERLRYENGEAQSFKYPKSLNQSTGFTSTWKVASWLAPSFSYNISTTENNNLTAKTITASGQSTEVGIGEVKSINRNADGGVSLTLNGNELLPNSKLFNTFVISNSFRIQDADTWNDVDSSFDSRKELWIRGSMGDVGPYGYLSSMTLRDTFTSSQRWSPFAKYEMAGFAEPLKTISIINNFSYTNQTNNQTGTQYDSVSQTLPDLVFSLSDWEKFFYAGSWLGGTNLKLRYSLIKQNTEMSQDSLETQYGGDLRFMLFNYFDNVLNFTRKTSDTQDLRAGTNLESYDDRDLSVQSSFYVGSMRLTPKLTYTSHDKWLVGKLNESTREMIPSLTLRWDFNLPRGIKLPFVDRMYSATNRVIWNTVLSYTDKSSPVEVTDNYEKYDITTSLDYEMSQNLRFNISGGYTVLKHAYVATEDYDAYNFAANVTVQF